MRLLLSIALIALISSLCVAQPGSGGPVVRNKFFTWSGGFAGCSNCGSPVTKFACSNGIGDWQDGYQTFSLSDVPTGYALTEVQVDLTGTFSCLTNQNSLVNVTLNGIIVDSKSLYGSSGCTCNSCDGTKTFSNKFFTRGFPGKFSGANNYLQVVSALSPICLSSANMTLVFSKPDFKAVSINIYPTSNNTIRTDCYACMGTNTSAVSSPNLIDFIFRDPLPAGKTPVAIAARVFGRWNGFYGSSGAVQIAVSGQTIASRTIPTQSFSSSNCNYCLGGLDWSSQMFMFGWPNYLAGGHNLLRIYQSWSSSTYAVGSITLTITYI